MTDVSTNSKVFKQLHYSLSYNYSSAPLESFANRIASLYDAGKRSAALTAKSMLHLQIDEEAWSDDGNEVIDISESGEPYTYTAPLSNSSLSDVDWIDKREAEDDDDDD